jgi:hypothetical protein
LLLPEDLLLGKLAGILSISIKQSSIINNHTSNDIVNIHTTNATGKFKYLQHSATWTPTPLAFSSLSASTAHSCSPLPLLLQLLELCPLPPVSGIT